MRPTVLLLPGLMCDGTVWRAQQAALANQYAVHIATYDDRDSLPAMAGAALAPIRGPVAVAGHSMGGRVGLELLRSHPGRVVGLGLLDTGFQALASGAAGERERSARMALLAKAERDGMRAMAWDWLQGMVHPRRLADATFTGEILDMFARRTPAQFAAQIRALLSRPDATALLAAIEVPTLVLCGREDSWSAPAQHQAMHARIRDSWFIEVPECGHMSTMEQPEAVNSALRDWLARL